MTASGERGGTPSRAEGALAVLDELDTGWDWYFAFDSTRGLYLYSDGFETLTGYGADELAGSKPWDFVPDAQRERLKAEVTRMIKDETRVSIEIDFRTRSGETVPYEFTGAPYYLPDDETVGIVGIGQEVVGHERDRETAERREEFLRLAQEAGNLGCWEVDFRSGIFSGTDHAHRIIEASPGTPLPLDAVFDRCHPADLAEVERAFDSLETGGSALDREVRLLLAEDSVKWVRLRGEPREANGEVVGARGTIQDITDQMQFETRFDEETERLKQFADVVAHDIRNPLQIATGQLEIADRTDDDAAFRRVENAHDRIQSITEDVELLAQRDRQIDKKWIDVPTLAREVWERLDTGIALETVPSWRMEADPNRLGRLFENLFRNAAEHAGPDATVTVGPIEPIATSTRSTADLSQGFYVADDGPGIQNAREGDVFETGYTTTADGPGFGLAIVAKIADAHGWEVEITEGYEGGAKFRFVPHDDPSR